MQAHAPPPGYFVHLEDTSSEQRYMSKKSRMRRWLCCTSQVEESSYPSNENERLKSPGNHTDGGMLTRFSLYASANLHHGK